MADDVLLAARALVLHDLRAHDLDLPPTVDLVDDVIAERRWWVTQWPAGAEHVAGQVAQDVQDRLLDRGLGRWPRCGTCTGGKIHELRIHPELGPDPTWVCEEAGVPVAALGEL